MDDNFGRSIPQAYSSEFEKERYPNYREQYKQKLIRGFHISSVFEEHFPADNHHASALSGL